MTKMLQAVWHAIALIMVVQATPAPRMKVQVIDWDKTKCLRVAPGITVDNLAVAPAKDASDVVFGTIEHKKYRNTPQPPWYAVNLYHTIPVAEGHGLKCMKLAVHVQQLLCERRDITKYDHVETVIESDDSTFTSASMVTQFSHSACLNQEPYSSPREYGVMANAVYNLGIEDTQRYLDARGMSGYTVLESTQFTGSTIFSGVQLLTEQSWNMALIADDRPLGERGYILSFEGTTHTGDWVGNLLTKAIKPWGMIKNMRKVLDEWFDLYNIAAIDGITGHSAGAVFAKYVFDQDELLEIGDPWIVTFDGFDPDVASGPRQIDIRGTGDVVSTCVGPKDPITLCTVEPNMGVIESHAIKNLDIDDVTWALLDLNDRYHFVKTPENTRETDRFKTCNAHLLDPGSRFYGQPNRKPDCAAKRARLLKSYQLDKFSNDET